MGKIKNFFTKLYYGLLYGMKGADNEILGNGGEENVGTTISQEVSDERVAKHLLKGEVTQEVEELRYRTYKVSDESENFKYLGNGVAIKDKEKKNNNGKKRIKFSQANENICESVLDTLKQVGSYGIERYRLEIEYKSFVRFKVEKYATRIDVNIDEDKEYVETVLHFSTEPNPYDGVSKPFISELEKLMTATTQYEINRNEIVSSINGLSFVTYKASNEDDMVTYGFMGGGKYNGIKKEKYEYLVSFLWDEYMRVPLDLETKYYSKSMAEKYENNEKKAVVVSINDAERKRYCSVCGKEMSTYDADIQEADGQEPICKECMQKVLNKK